MIGAAILGLLAGFLARALLPGKQELGFFATLLLGIAGALVGFFFFTELLGIGDTEMFDLGGLVGAVIGSMVLLFIYDRIVASRAAKSAPAAAAGSSAPRKDREPRPERERSGGRREGRDREAGGGRP
ncbi:MAG: GlsB/YeaQ/YmgE family stress response membrane protein, partial [Rhodoplanes sp.]